MKKVINFIIICSLVYLSLYNIFLLFYPFPNQCESVVITPHSDSIQVASILEENGLVKNKFYFLVVGQIFKIFHNLKAGEYEFGKRVSTWNVLNKLAKGEIAIYKITIPEGWTIQDIVCLLSEKGLINPERFLALAENANFMVESYKFPKNLEGYLFPDTYYFTKGVDTEESIIAQMLSQFKRRVIDKYGDEIRTRKYSLDRIIILASLIEKEAVVNYERPVISKVFYNRLKRKMLLQCDPTVRYALGKFEGKLTLYDLNVKSPFNTYIHTGLPPHPICNPGIASIRAAIYPADVDYLYFVSKNDGTHYFTKNYEEHREAKKKYQGT